MLQTSSNRWTHVLATLALAFGILAAAPVAQDVYAHATKEKPQLALPRVPLGNLEEGDLIARLSVERLSLELPVLEGIGLETLSEGPGHLPGTALPGEEAAGSHSVIAIPRDTGYGISGLRVGDRVEMRTPFGVREYCVVSRRVHEPNEIDHRPAAAKPRVTLVTPYPADAIGPAPMRLAVMLEAR